MHATYRSYPCHDLDLSGPIDHPLSVHTFCSTVGHAAEREPYTLRGLRRTYFLGWTCSTGINTVPAQHLMRTAA